MPSGPRLSSRNSRTSRPRSPTSAMTLTSLCAWRASMPSRVDLPPPAMANTPRRWPSPTVSRPSMARTPVTKGRSTGRRVSGLGGSDWNGRSAVLAGSGRPSSGSPKASSTRPSRPRPTGTRAPRSMISTSAPIDTPCKWPSGTRMASCSRRPTTSARRGAACGWAGSRIRHCWPMWARRPLTRSVVPKACTTRPRATTGCSACRVSSSAGSSSGRAAVALMARPSQRLPAAGRAGRRGLRPRRPACAGWFRATARCG